MKTCSGAAAGRLLLTTNVGVRVNARLTQQLPEFAVTEKSANDKQWLDNVFAAFEPFLHTPDGQPRPLTVTACDRSQCADQIAQRRGH